MRIRAELIVCEQAAHSGNEGGQWWVETVYLPYRDGVEEIIYDEPPWLDIELQAYTKWADEKHVDPLLNDYVHVRLFRCDVVNNFEEGEQVRLIRDAAARSKGDTGIVDETDESYVIVVADLSGTLFRVHEDDLERVDDEQ